MPAIIVAAASAAASGFVSAAVGGGLLGALAGAAASAVVAGTLGKVLMPTAKGSSQTSFTATEQGISSVTRGSVEPWRVVYGRKKVSGTLVFVHTTQQGYASQANLNSYAPTLVTDTRDNAFLHMIVAVAAHEVDAIESVFLGDVELTLDGNGYATNTPYQTNYINGSGQDNGTYRFARVKKYLGSPTQTADLDLQAVFSGWTLNHRLQGIAYLYICLRWYDRVFPNGIPNVSAIVRGAKVYDPRTAVTAYSNNWALCVRDYLTNGVYGVGCAADEVDDAACIAAANVSDENVLLDDGVTTQKRYTMDGVVDTSLDFNVVLDKMCSSAAGVVTYSQGMFQMHAAAYSTPTVTIDASWIRGEITVQAKTPHAQLYNAVRGVYVEPSKLWELTDFPAIQNASYAAEDNETIFRDLELPFVVHVQRAQRLATLYLKRGRYGVTVVLPCNVKALQLRVWDVIMLTLPIYGFAAKPFRIAGWRLSGEGGIDLELKEEAPAIYAWTAAEAALYPDIPATNLPSPSYVAPSGAPIVTEEIYVTTEGAGVKSRALISWAESAGPFVYRYRLEYKRTDETDYRLGVETKANSAQLEDLAPATYQFRIKTINSVLAESDYSGITTYALQGLTAPPADVTGLTLNELKGSAHIKWDQAVDLDVRIGGAVRVRHSPLSTGATWSGAVDIGDRISGIATETTLPLLTGTYLVKFVDSTGSESVNATNIGSKLADLLSMNIVLTDDEAPSFSGTKSNMSVSGGVLSLTSGQTVGTYDFSTSGGASIDLKQVISCRIMATIMSTIYRATNLWDSASGLWDDASGQFDGADITGVAAQLYVRTTDDDPAVTPTWSGWRQFFVGDFVARAFQFQLRIMSDDSSKNIDITALSVSADVPDRDERHYNVSVGVGGSTEPFDTPYYTQPQVVPSVQSYTAGDNVKIIFTSSGGKFVSFTATVYNAAGSSVAKTVDFYVRGY